MTRVFPDYYKDFSCIKGACKHSCCIGWEIDIDDERIPEYLSLDGALGQKMKNSVSFDGTPHFCLDKQERCPFLNGEGLCELIIEKGPEYLTTICREHPRFYNELSDRIEGGLGLCCEEAARLILGQQSAMTLIYDRAPLSTNPITQKRDLILSVIADRSTPLRKRQQQVLSLCNGTRLPLSTKELVTYMLTLERLDEKWGKLLNSYLLTDRKVALEKFEEHIATRLYEFENLFSYLIYRHFINGSDMEEAALRGLFALQICQLLFELSAMILEETGTFEFEDMVELCRLYSSEIEYSDENPEKILDELYFSLN